MKNINFLLNILDKSADSPAIVWRDQSVSYRWLASRISELNSEMNQMGLKPGTVVSLTGDFSPNSIALLLALTGQSCIIAPILRTANDLQKQSIAKIAQVQFSYSVEADDTIRWEATPQSAEHPHYQTIRERETPGLVLFSSGSSGVPKAAVHDFSLLLEKFKLTRHSLRILNFLLFDHWGGLNTLLHTLSSGGTVFAMDQRSPDSICSAIEKHQIEVLPASPTFLNLLMISEAYKRYNLASLKIISYGTEPMPLNTLKKVQEMMPRVKLQQTYGLIELGVLRTQSKDNHSLWMKVGGEGYETRVIDGMLQIKARSAMLGYLNAVSPFTEDGWYMTGDQVAVEGEYIQVLGRKSELINVGGEKVYPQEIENIIQEAPNVAEVTVYGEKNPLIGNIVCAKVRWIESEDSKAMVQRLRKYCKERLPSFKVPVKIEIVTESQVSHRFKKQRAPLEV